jgi:hypothetical protein
MPYLSLCNCGGKSRSVFLAQKAQASPCMQKSRDKTTAPDITVTWLHSRQDTDEEESCPPLLRQFMEFSHLCL